MSFELLLLLFVFVLLPLIQRLLQAARQRDGSTPERDEGRPASPQRPPVRDPQPAPAPYAQQPAAPAAPPPPATVRHTVSGKLAARERVPARVAAGLVAPAPTARRSARQRPAMPGLLNPLEMRRAIVLMAILGPCRALSPHDWPERAGPR